ncbi:MAG: ISAs1 family transposase [Synechococcaceae cyanobacterium SM2_3_1]|nr:ISAs1 family transposase [Synechococcaceae cyanobacterium SM2_3_1]
MERGLILEPYPVDCKTNEIKALPEFIEQLALKGVVIAFDAMSTQKTCQLILDSENHYLGALKGNQGLLHKSVQAHFIAETSYTELSKGHGRVEKRVISLCTTLDDIKPWPGLKTLIRVESERQFNYGGQLRQETETRYYIASYLDSADAFAQRIRGYWGVENKVHHVRDVTQGEDASRIRMYQLPQIFAVARNFALNLYRSNQFSNMAQAERLCKFGLDTLKSIFRMK